MPLNVKKAYTFIPNPIGGVKIQTRSSIRSRLYAGGTYFRSIELGQTQNLITLSVLEDVGTNGDKYGLFVVENFTPVFSEVIFSSGFSNTGNQSVINAVQIFQLQLKFNEEIAIVKNLNGTLRGSFRGIRWQIAGGELFNIDIGIIPADKVFVLPSITALKINSSLINDWPVGASIILRPRTTQYTLSSTTITDPITMQSSIGWDIDALRAAVNTDNKWISMPLRSKADPMAPSTVNSDVTDLGADSAFLTVFDRTAMTGGDGLPMAPVGLNTGPDRSLIHLNYSEIENGSTGVLNHLYEWVGSAVNQGSWQRYS
jgi:hypothetical protein